MERTKKFTRVRPKNPYIRKQPLRKIKPGKMLDIDGVLDIDTELDLLKSDSEASQNSVVIRDSVKPGKPSLEMANNEVMSLIKEIREYQSTQCTKNDLQAYSLTIKEQFTAVDQRVSNNASAIDSMAARLCSIESQLRRNDYEAELNKQNALSLNLSIMGITATNNENITVVALKVFSLIGCELTRTDVFSCYRIKKSGAFTNIFIVKLNDFAVKQRILKAKVNKEVRLRDVIGNSSSDGNPLIFINNHVTPYFGRLLAEGRRAIKTNTIHSVWLSKNGCQFRVEANGIERSYQSIQEFNDMVSSLNNRPSMNQGKPPKRSKPDDNDISPKNIQKSKK